MAERYKEPEIWRGIEGCSKYQVSSFGNVRNVKTGRILKRKGKYKNQVTLIDDKGRKRILL